jgi:hypothetical protein
MQWLQNECLWFFRQELLHCHNHATSGIVVVQDPSIMPFFWSFFSALRAVNMTAPQHTQHRSHSTLQAHIHDERCMYYQKMQKHVLQI